MLTSISHHNRIEDISAKADNVLRHAIDLISKFGFEQLSINQIMISGKISFKTITTVYDNLDIIKQESLYASIGELLKFLQNSTRATAPILKIRPLWELFMKFILSDQKHSRVIQFFVRYPDAVCGKGFTNQLALLLSPIFETLDHPVGNKGPGMKFLVFRSMFTHAWLTLTANKDHKPYKDYIITDTGMRALIRQEQLMLFDINTLIALPMS